MTDSWIGDFLLKRRLDMAKADGQTTESGAGAAVASAGQAGGAYAGSIVKSDGQEIEPDPNQAIKDLLLMTNALTNDLGNLSTQAVRVGNYSLASKALKYAKGLIEASDEVVRGLEDAGGK